MTARLTTLWESVSTSLWFVPGLLTACAALLAWLSLSLPIELPDVSEPVWWLHSGSAEDATTLLSDLLTSMITMATLAISITMVVLTLAAGQLGPRLIRSFMADKRTQLMLGVFLATIVYLLLILRVVINGAQGDSVPRLAVSIGTLIVLVSVFVLLFYVHHLARAIVSDTVIQRVGRDLDASIRQMLPDADAPPAAPYERRLSLEGGTVLSLPRGGYIQAVDYAGLVDCARRSGAVIQLGFRPGSHVLAFGDHGRVGPASAVTEDLPKNISEYVVIGNERTASQDLEFAIRQLVEIAVRALSPGINDPFTAIAAIDRLGISLAHVMKRGSADGVWRDGDGKVRVVGTTTTFRGIVDAAFNQIRQAGDGKPDVLIRILATLARLAEHARDDMHRRVLAKHVNIVFAAGERSVAEPHDLRAMEERRARALSCLGRR